ncbi:hypothetical protein BGX29_003135 [Mortierella sp. GBA35]|nr:hypothetical protein BGX23_003581 [Mortierella sp. AD031]KAF9103617.1 hypothetical protein BGX29_003135 [Mortierella sp. GBA35]KAG0214209.1 hypothetical protein BGX33_002343 [Mortierella sp. NVP41]
MGSKSKSKSASKRAPASSEPQDHAAPAHKRSKKTNEMSSSIMMNDEEPHVEPSIDVDMEEQEAQEAVAEDEDNDNDDNDLELQNDRESSDDEADIEDDEDQELRSNARSTLQKEAHTSDRVQKVLTNPEIEAAFQDKYMTQITQAFGDELNTLRETDSLEGAQLELLIDSLNQTGHIYRVMEKELWVAEGSQ